MTISLILFSWLGILVFSYFVTLYLILPILLLLMHILVAIITYCILSTPMISKYIIKSVLNTADKFGNNFCKNNKACTYRSYKPKFATYIHYAIESFCNLRQIQTLIAWRCIAKHLINQIINYKKDRV